MQNSRLSIINFHGIGSPKRVLEEGEAPYWISEQQYRQFLDLIVPVKDKTIITFDDGNLSDLEIGAKELGERQLTATFFPLAGRLESEGSLGRSHLLELLHLGHRIGNHGYDHVSWKNLDDAGAQKELVDARSQLEDSIGEKITEAAIPFGQYGKNTLERLKAAGYERAYSSDGGSYRGKPFPTPRWSVRADTSQQDVENFLAGHESVARRMRRSLAKAKKQML
ncbi:polysaccharide deacetylase family protein [uncultured Roseibium sp.]|uniref:polysaccharide deacetylase family protein n=1 Tax=uncultured Roseibium sp. TaxID=1936171 RepID=UPI0026116228|nr:polysaccharide deacetylase family protein [uncultured Roseibium sp.]